MSKKNKNKENVKESDPTEKKTLKLNVNATTYIPKNKLNPQTKVAPDTTTTTTTSEQPKTVTQPPQQQKIFIPQNQQYPNMVNMPPQIMMITNPSFGYRNYFIYFSSSYE